MKVNRGIAGFIVGACVGGDSIILLDQALRPLYGLSANWVIVGQAIFNMLFMFSFAFDVIIRIGDHLRKLTKKPISFNEVKPSTKIELRGLAYGSLFGVALMGITSSLSLTRLRLVPSTIHGLPWLSYALILLILIALYAVVAQFTHVRKEAV